MNGRSAFASIVELDVSKVHPFCRVELARFLCITIAAVCKPQAAPDAPSPACELLPLVSQPTLQFAIFLLASRHQPLHKEACAALLAARSVYRRHREETAERLVWPVNALTVPAGGTERPLAEVLKELMVAQGGQGSLLSAEECAELLADESNSR